MKKINKILKGNAAAGRIANILWPIKCPLCEKILPDSRMLLCDNCAKTLPWTGENVCMKCGRPLISGREEYCEDCKVNPHEFTAGKSVFVYEGKLRESVLRMKFHNRRIYIRFYAAAMAGGAGEWIRSISPGCLIPVPMHKRKRKERGFDPCALITENLSDRTGIPAVYDRLVRIRRTNPQNGLDAMQRRSNLKGAIEVAGDAPVKEPVLLIDDIYTTGATIDECCRALKRKGVKEIYFLTLCTGRDKIRK